MKMPSIMIIGLGDLGGRLLDSIIRWPNASPVIVGARNSDAAEEVERFTQYLLEALGESGYLKPLTSASMVEKTRRMIRRSIRRLRRSLM